MCRSIVAETSMYLHEYIAAADRPSAVYIIIIIIIINIISISIYFIQHNDKVTKEQDSKAYISCTRTVAHCNQTVLIQRKLHKRQTKKIHTNI